MAFEKLSLRGVSNYDTALVSRVVKHADGEYIRVADIRYDPSHDATASMDITDGEMKAVMVVTEPGPGGADISADYVRSFLGVQGRRSRNEGGGAAGVRGLPPVRAADGGGGRDKGA